MVRRSGRGHRFGRCYVIHGHYPCYHEKLIPLAPSEPFLKICDRLGVEPVLRYASLCLYNWGGGGQRDAVGSFKFKSRSRVPWTRLAYCSMS